MESLSNVERQNLLGSPSIDEIKTRANQITAEKNYLDAVKLYEQAIELDPHDLDTYLSMSAALNEANKHELARDVLKNGIEKRPYITHSFDGKPKATILQLLGVQNCKFRTKKHGRYLEGGHFSTKYLIDREKFKIISFHVLDENLTTYDDFPTYDIIVNSIADPDKEEASLRTVAGFMRKNPDIPIINDPEAVLLTTRNENYERLRDIPGVVFPKTVRLPITAQNIQSTLERIECEGFSYPILLRQPGWHTGTTFMKAEDSSKVKKYVETNNPKELYVTQFIDTSVNGMSIFTKFHKYFRKMRIFCIDGQIYPVVCHFDKIWNVHGGYRKNLMIRNRWMREEEFIFVSDYKYYIGTDAAETLERICSSMRLDFFGVDFNVLPDGKVLIYEINPAMRHSFSHGKTFSYIMPYLEEVSDAFQRMIMSRLAHIQ